MSALSDRINMLSESETLAMTRKSRELKAQGFDVINLSIGEPDFNTPDYVKDAAKKAIDDNYSFYTPVSGYQDLRETICMKFKRDNGLDFTPDQIVVSTGAKQSIANVVLSLVNPGEEVLIPAPYWVSYREIIKLAEGKPVFINTSVDSDFKITAEQLEKSITPKSKLMIFSSPCNPSGSVYTIEELKSLADVLAKHPNIYIVSDEIYEKINFSGKHASIGKIDSLKERTITVNGISKGYAMTGWRLGYIGAPKFIAQACDKLQGQFTSATCSISQRAAITALSVESEVTLKMRDEFLKRRDLVIKMLREIPGFKVNVPQGAFYVFPDISYYFGKSNGNITIKNAGDLANYLLTDAYVALVPGEAFGDPRCIRFSYATSKELLIESINRIKKSLEKLS
ncbi:MAG: pyridoxal phosphate-dependent aminotransferase [Bacteroidota bacterium]|nr:pyridoxal phosphate-dependent aminotransferase [Bacteroidota bacterium]